MTFLFLILLSVTSASACTCIFDIIICIYWILFCFMRLKTLFWKWIRKLRIIDIFIKYLVSIVLDFDELFQHLKYRWRCSFYLFEGYFGLFFIYMNWGESWGESPQSRRKLWRKLRRISSIEEKVEENWFQILHNFEEIFLEKFEEIFSWGNGL